MTKQKTIKLKAAEKKEADRKQREITIAMFGQETAQRIHFDARERLWMYLRNQYPEITRTAASYDKGIITYTPLSKGGA